MSIKHTPGPWRCEGSSVWRENGLDMDQPSLATTHGPFAEANARLIAAAPELLEAASNVFDKLWDNYGNGYGTEYEDVIAELQVVIAKATNG